MNGEGAVRLALLKGNRFNPWHLRAFDRLPGHPEVVAFRAESEIQRYFDAQDDGSAPFRVERIYFDTESKNPLRKLARQFSRGHRDPHILPFYKRLEGFDLIHTWELFTDWTAEAVKAKRAFDIPLAVMVWDNIPYNMETAPERREMKRAAVEAADVFIVHTERSRLMLDFEGAPAERVVKVHHGVDTDAFAPGPRERAPLGLPDGAFVILFVGWFLPRKGLDFLILALRELLRDSECRDRNLQLLMIGTGPGKERIDALIDRAGVRERCRFAGPLPYGQMPAVFRAADVFVLPSIAERDWQEQFGMSLIEAMACGVPAVATLSGAIPEVAGDAALLCQPNDVIALRDALKRLILSQAERNHLSRKGRQRALQHFRLAQYAQALSHIYETILRKH